MAARIVPYMSGDVIIPNAILDDTEAVNTNGDIVAARTRTCQNTPSKSSMKSMTTCGQQAGKGILVLFITKEYYAETLSSLSDP
jgi:hypothetical protein